MNAIAQALLAIRDALPNGDCGLDGESPFICDTVDRLQDTGGERPYGAALAFLHELGMGCGLTEFVRPGRGWMDGPNSTPIEQCDRKAWLTFAAELAEEWEVRE